MTTEGDDRESKGDDFLICFTFRKDDAATIAEGGSTDDPGKIEDRMENRLKSSSSEVAKTEEKQRVERVARFAED